jgi:serine/threonine protein kinase
MNVWGGKWKKVRGLASGGQGDTFLVASVEDSAREAVLKQANRPSSKARTRMLEEVSNLSTLHEAQVKVPGVLDLGSMGGFATDSEEAPWFVMDFIRGKTLDAHLRDSGPLNLDRAVAVTLDLARTVDLAHKKGVLHRDLKPANLMVRGLDPADVVLLDCGLSFHSSDAEVDLTGDEPIRNKFLSLSEGNNPGGNRRDPRSDLTAVAGILFYCLTRENIGLLFDERGLPPHRRPGCTMQEVLGSDPRRGQVDLFFDRAFAVDINNRFQTPEELVSRLRTLADQPAATFRNPVQVANTRAAGLRARHRRTQLAEYGNHFQKTLSPAVNNWLGQTAQNTPRPYFFGQMSLHDINKDLPPEMETMWFEGNVQSILFAVTVSYYGHPRTWLFPARTAVRGDEGVPLGLITRVTTTPDFSRPWEELMIFNPSELPPPEDFIRHFDEGLSRAIDELSDDVEQT